MYISLLTETVAYTYSMSLLLLFAFLSGLVTTLTPCVLPILPVVLATTAQNGVRRPLGVVFGLIVSFTFFTLFLTSIIKLLGLPDDLMRLSAVAVLFLFGLVMVVPRLAMMFEKTSSRLTNNRIFSGLAGGKTGFWGGFVIGCVLGLLWTPCAGPILASVIVLAATSSVTIEAVLITFAYACGTAVVLLFIMYGGRNIVQKLRSVGGGSGRMQQVFGLVMMAMAIVVFMQWDRLFQAYIVQRLPTWALTPLLAFESNEQVTRALDGLQGRQEKVDAPQFDKARLLSNYGSAPELQLSGKWLNTDVPISLDSIKGEVVLVDFWTYSCVNCIRTLPYLKKWQETYQNEGFTVIGVHSPEFAFEKVDTNVEKAINDYGINYPVMMDNDFLTWRAYKNRYWPAKYLIDAQGFIRYQHFGEGNYDQTERAIQLLLEEKGRRVDYEIESESLISYRGRTPETYMGYRRLDDGRFKIEGSITRDVFRKYIGSSFLSRDDMSLEGDWKITEEYAEARTGSKLRIKFSSKEANLVMGVNDRQSTDLEDAPVFPAVTNSLLPKGSNFCTNEVCVGGGDEPSKDAVPVKVRFYDSRMINTQGDLPEGIVYVNQSKLYKLVELSNEQEGIIELEYMGDGVKTYAWTF